MRISGFASGLDIDSMVKELMTAQRVPLDKLSQQKQTVEWKREGYREMSTKLVSFSNNTLMNLSLSSSTNAMKANVTGATGVVSATTTGAATNGSMTIEVKSLATASTVKSGTGMGAKEGTAIVSSEAAEIFINKVPITVDANDTIDSLISKINSNKDAKVTAVYDEKKGTLSLTNKESGKKELSFSGDVLDQFGLGAVKPGENAVVTINGLEMEKESNNFTVNGVNISLTGTHQTGQVTTINIAQDTDQVIDNIKKFVEAYNDLISSVNGKVGEERYRTYTPLTDDQKSDMTEDEIKLWESKAKSGMLKNDSILQQTLSEMRTALMQDVNIGRTSSLNTGDRADLKTLNLSQLGITTGTWSEQGKLYVDESKLRDALSKDPNAVSDFFGSKTVSTSSTTRYEDTDGIYSRLRKISQNSLESLASTAGTSKTSSDLNATFMASSLMGEQLKGIDDRITALKARLVLKENQFYKQFTAMEVAMNKYNSTSSSLSSFMS